MIEVPRDYYVVTTFGAHRDLGSCYVRYNLYASARRIGLLNWVRYRRSHAELRQLSSDSFAAFHLAIPSTSGLTDVVC